MQYVQKANNINNNRNYIKQLQLQCIKLQALDTKLRNDVETSQCHKESAHVIFGCSVLAASNYLRGCDQAYKIMASKYELY
jgi:hypothetical protein